MRTYSFVTVDVFTDRRCGGNPLAVFPTRAACPTAKCSPLAAESTSAKRTFVVPPENPANTARVRIFQSHQRDAVLPAIPMSARAGCWPAWCRDRGGVLRFEEIAGLGRGERRARRQRRSPPCRHHRRTAAALARRRNAGRIVGRLYGGRCERRHRIGASAGRGLRRQFLRDCRSHGGGPVARRP